MNVFPFIEAEKVEQHDTVQRSCELLEVSRSAFYEWHKHVPSVREAADDELGERIQDLRRVAVAPTAPRCIGHYETRATCPSGAGGANHAHQGPGGPVPATVIKTTISDPDVVAVDLLKRTFAGHRRARPL